MSNMLNSDQANGSADIVPVCNECPVLALCRTPRTQASSLAELAEGMLSNEDLDLIFDEMDERRKVLDDSPSESFPSSLTLPSWRALLKEEVSNEAF